MDREIADLQVATARAYAVAAGLARELESVVSDLIHHVERSRAGGDGADVAVTPSRKEQHP